MFVDACGDQKKEMLLQACMKHENVVEVKDIVQEILPAALPRVQNEPQLIVRTQADCGRSIGQHARS